MEKEIDIYKGYYNKINFSSIADYLKIVEEKINKTIKINFFVKKYEIKFDHIFARHFFTIMFEKNFDNEKVKKFISKIEFDGEEIRYQIKGRYLFLQIFV